MDIYWYITEPGPYISAYWTASDIIFDTKEISYSSSTDSAWENECHENIPAVPPNKRSSQCTNLYASVQTSFVRLLRFNIFMPLNKIDQSIPQGNIQSH